MSEQTASLSPDAQDVPRISRRPVVLMTLLVALMLVAVGQFAWTHRRSEQDVRLHGNLEEAPGALEEILVTTPHEKRISLLLKYSQDESPGLRYAAVDMLGKEQGPDVADCLEKAFQDSASIVRVRTMEVLPVVDKERGVRLQLAALRDEDYWVRDAAISQLSIKAGMKNSGVDQRAVPILIKALDDSDSTVPAMAVTALRKLTKQNWRYPGRGTPEQQKAVLDACRQWWANNRVTWSMAAEWADVSPIRPNRTDPAPDFSLHELNGNRISLRGQKGHITLLNFWGTWCAFCRKEVPDLARLDREYQGRNVDIIGIAHAEKGKEAVQQWCQRHDILYPQALSTPNLMEDFGDIHEVPVSVLIDGQGRIRYRWEGERDYATYHAAIERLLNEPGAKP